VGELVVRQGLSADWDRLAMPRAPTLSTRWIKLVENRYDGPMQTFALLDDGQMAIAMCGAVLGEPGANRRMDPYRILVGEAVGDGLLTNGPHPWLGRAIGEVYPCLHLMFPNYETAPVGSLTRDADTTRTFLDLLVEYARARDLRSVVATYLRPDCTTLLDVMRGAGWLVAPMTDRCDLEVGWTDFDGYLASLQSKRRIAVQRELRDLEEKQVELTERRLEADEPEIVALRCQLTQKYGGHADPAKETALLARVRKFFDPKDLLVFEARRRERLHGFTMFVRDDAHWTAFLTGTDYTNPAAQLSYFATCFYQPAARAPRVGVEAIAYGFGAWQAKRLRGCRLRPVHIAVRRIEESA